MCHSKMNFLSAISRRNMAGIRGLHAENFSNRRKQRERRRIVFSYSSLCLLCSLLFTRSAVSDLDDDIFAFIAARRRGEHTVTGQNVLDDLLDATHEDATVCGNSRTLRRVFDMRTKPPAAREECYVFSGAPG
jgi:hypothetical protein